MNYRDLGYSSFFENPSLTHSTSKLTSAQANAMFSSGSISGTQVNFPAGFTTDIVFSSTDNNTAAWTEGVVYIFDGTQSETIGASNTGDITSTTYIYYDRGKPRDLQTTTSPGIATGANKFLMAIVEKVTDDTKLCKITPVGCTGLVVSNIDTDQIAADAITADVIEAGSITTTELSFTPLESADGTDDIIATINASAEGITIDADNISISGDCTFSSGYDPADVRHASDVTKIDGGEIYTGSITTTQLNFTPVQDTDVIASINASVEGITIEADNITIAGTTTFTSGWAAASNAESDINCLNTSNAPAEAGADVTSSHTANDTSYVNSLASSSVAGWAHASDTTKIDGGDIYTNTVTATQIAASTITTTELNFTPVQNTDVIASINASAEGIRIDADNISISGSTTFTTGWAAASNAESDINVLNTTNAPAEAGADVTGSNTAANTTNVGSVSAANVAGWAHGSDTTKIDGGDIYTGSVTATQITVTNLSALSADMGTITAGTVTLDAAGYLRGGQTDYDAGSGFFLGYSTDAYKFSIGDGDENFLTWDGDTLDFSGTLTLKEPVTIKSYTVANLPGGSTSTSWTNPTANENATDGITNPEYSYTSDNNRTMISDASGKYYDLKTFGFSIPATSTVLGIRVRAEISPASSGTGACEINLSDDGGSTWYPSDVGDNLANSNTADEYRYAGTSTDLWGTTWSNTSVNDTNFRVRVKSDSAVATATTRVDHVQVRIWYVDSATSAQTGALAYASDGRKAGEGAGSGTGVLVFFDGSNWCAVDTGATVAA